MAFVIITDDAYKAFQDLAARVLRLNVKNPEIGAGMLADLYERAGRAQTLGIKASAPFDYSAQFDEAARRAVPRLSASGPCSLCETDDAGFVCSRRCEAEDEPQRTAPQISTKTEGA